MKKIVAIIFLFVTVFVVSCSKEDNNMGESNSVTGRWVLQEMIELNTMKEVPYTDGIEYTFKADETFTGISVDIDFDGSDVVTKKIAISGTYVLSDNGQKITIRQNGGQTLVFDIYDLSSKKMILRGKFQNFQVESTFSKK
ncbi:lipocalin-like domain-containing protein [Sphingobacterium anhuiense]|uniref:Lipocalin family protein n=1 Tax=Sphingobacterium anhuiense TaxID=493780 RepID=A0ABW5Z2H9_9SPHI